MREDRTPVWIKTFRNGNEYEKDEARAWFEKSYKSLVKRELAYVMQRLGMQANPTQKHISLVFVGLFLYFRSASHEDAERMNAASVWVWLKGKVHRTCNPQLTLLQHLGFILESKLRIVKLGAETRRRGHFLVTTIRHPVDPVGGDWDSHGLDKHKNLWVVVCDATGHGYLAWLATRDLSWLWDAVANEIDGATSPMAALNQLNSAFEDLLPDPMCFDAKLFRLTPSGYLEIAGGCRFLLHEKNGAAVDEGMTDGCGALGGGMWISDAETYRRQLEKPAELLMGSDGLFDLYKHHYKDHIPPALRSPAEGGKLHKRTQATLREALKRTSNWPERDDITAIVVGCGWGKRGVGRI